MTLSEHVPIPEASVIHERLKDSSLREVTPLIVSREEIEQGWVAVSVQEVIDIAFGGRERRAHYFLELLQNRPEITVLIHPDNELLCLEVAGWNGTAEYTMRLLIEPEALRDQISIEAQNVFIINTKSGKAVSIQSILPLYEGAVQHIPIQFFYSQQNSKNDKEHTMFEQKNASYFGAADFLAVGEVHTTETLQFLLHEAGHLWTWFLGITRRTRRQQMTKGSSFSYASVAEEQGGQEAVELAQEIGFSERMANVVGKLLYRKLKQAGFYAPGQRINWVTHSDTYGSTYDATHAMLHLQDYELIQSAFVSRFNRTSEGRALLEREVSWITEQITTFLQWTSTLPLNVLDSHTIGSRHVQKWKMQSTNSNLSCTLKRDTNGNFRSADVNFSLGDRKVHLTITDFDGITFSDTALHPSDQYHIAVGVEDKKLDDKRNMFEGILRELLQSAFT